MSCDRFAIRRRCDRRPAKPIALVLLFLGICFSSPSLWAEDRAWFQFEAGKRFFEEKSYGEALNSWKQAIDERRTGFRRASEGVAAAINSKEGGRARGSIRSLLRLLAEKEFGARQVASLETESGGSLRRAAELLKSRKPSTILSDFLDGLLLVIGVRGGDFLLDSLASLDQAAHDLEFYPEAEWGIAKIYLLEGEVSLAELQYKRTLEQASSLEIPAEIEMIRGELAGLYRLRGDWKNYEELLVESLANSGIFSEKQSFLRKAMERALYLEGFDSFLSLYRIDEAATLRPAADIGEYFLRHGRQQAVINLAVAANGELTRIIESIRIAEPAFAFTGLAPLLERIHRDPQLWAFAKNENLYRTLYFLGEALLDQGQRISARGIFTTLAASTGSGSWAKASSLALSRPADAIVILP
jgi:hypothetical protein